MSESDYSMLIEQFARLREECTTPEKATTQLQSEGILDADGDLATKYRESAKFLV